MTAQRLLDERQDRAAVPMLDRSAQRQDQSPGAASCPLDVGGSERTWTAAVLNDVVADPHPALREHALRVATVIEPHAPERLISTARLVKLARDPAIRVRLQVALALGNRCREEPAALDALGKIAAKDADDPWMRLAILSGLAESSLAFIAIVRSDSLRVGPGPTAVASRRDRGRSPPPDRARPLCWE